MSIQAASLVAKVEIQGDEEAKRKLKGVGETADKVGGGFKGMLGGALSFAGGLGIFSLASNAVGLLKDQLGGVFQESMDAQAGMALTNAVLKSTHDASGETAQSIADLAGNLSHLTKFSDDTVQAGENMLLTFTNIGKNVFPQATKTVLDMSQALGQDTKSSAIQLGKALNDPITGVTALQRVGVTFDKTQKDLIKTYMAHNQIAKAQGVILKELQKEFGGAAVAAGKTFGGQLVIANQYVSDIKQNIGDALMPIVTNFLGELDSKGMPILTKFSDWFVKDGLTGLEKFAGGIFDAADKSGAFQSVLKMINDVLPDLKSLLGTLGYTLTNDLLPPTLDLIKNFSTWIDTSGILTDGLHFLGDTVSTLVGILGPLIQDVSNLFKWLSENKPASDALKDAILLLGGAFVALKLVDTVAGFGQMFTKLKDVDGIARKLFPNIASIGSSAKTSAAEVTGAALIEEADMDAVDTKVKGVNADMVAMGPAAAEGGAAAKLGLSGLLGTLGTIAGFATLLALPFFTASPSTKAALFPDKKDQYQAPPGFWDFITHQGLSKNQTQDFAQVMGRPAKEAQDFANSIDRAWQDMEAIGAWGERHQHILGDLSDPLVLDKTDTKVMQIKEHLDDLAKPVVLKPLTSEVVAARLKVIDLKSHLDDLEKNRPLSIGTRSVDNAILKVMNLKSHIDDLPGVQIPGGSGFRGHAQGIMNNPIGHLGLVGEQGPELMYVPQGASIFPNSQSMQMTQGGGNDSNANRPVYLVMDGYIHARGMMPYIADQMRYNVNSRVA